MGTKINFFRKNKKWLKKNLKADSLLYFVSGSSGNNKRPIAESFVYNLKSSF